MWVMDGGLGGPSAAGSMVVTSLIIDYLTLIFVAPLVNAWITNNLQCTMHTHKHVSLICYHAKSPILCMLCYFITQQLKNMFL